MEKMRATVFHGVNDIHVEEVERPRAGIGEAVVKTGRVDLTPLLTHSFPLSEITEAYRVFGERLDGVIKVGIRP